MKSKSYIRGICQASHVFERKKVRIGGVRYAKSFQGVKKFAYNMIQSCLLSSLESGNVVIQGKDGGNLLILLEIGQDCM